MLRQGADTLIATLAAVVADGYLLDQAIEALRAYSLITRDISNKGTDSTSACPAVVRDSLSAEVQKQWMLHVIVLRY